MYTFTYPRDKFNENKLDKQIIRKLIIKHQSYVSKIVRNRKYYEAEHTILESDHTTKIVHNHAKDISDIAAWYFMGNPIKYDNTGDADIEPLLVAFDNAGADDADADNAINASICGVAYEYIYPIKDTTTLTIKTLDSEHTFIVKDDSIEENELFAVYYYPKKDDVNDKLGWYANIYTAHYKYEMVIENTESTQGVKERPEEHNMGEIPVIEIRNNKQGIGDFEQQIGIIDAYNSLMSDRVEDKDQFVDAILMLYGGQLADEEDYDENTNDDTAQEKAYRQLKKKKLLELPPDAKAEYLTRTFDENGIEVLRKALKNDIYNLSQVPNLSDENFAGNSSGVAMEYKLLGLEMLTKTKQRYYRKALKKRIRLFCNYLGLQKIMIDANSIVPVFTRGLPRNLVEMAQTIANLKDMVSQRTLIGMLPFVEDPDKELAAVQEEQSKKVQQQKELFMTNMNEQPEEE